MTDLETIEAPTTPEVTTPDVPAAAPEAPAAPVTEPAAAAPSGDAPAASAEAAPPAAPTVREIVGRLNGQEYKVAIPEGFELPWKREDETGFMDIDKVLRAPMFERDYQHKTKALAAQRRELEARDVELRARTEQATENRRKYLEAVAQGGEAARRELEHQERMETDPDYRQRWDESEEFRIRQRMDAYSDEVAEGEETSAISDRIGQYIAAECQKYPGVDPDRVRTLYARALQAGAFTRMHADDVDQVIRDEVAVIERGRAPVTNEMETMRRQIADLQAQLAASSANARVVDAVDRAARPRVAVPARGAVPGTAPFKPFDPVTETEEQFRARWRARGAA